MCQTSPRASFGSSARVHDPVHRRRLVLAQDELLQLLVFLGEDDKVLQQLQHMRHGAEALDLGFEVADLLVLPVEDIPPHRVPGHAVGEADGLGRGEEHLAAPSLPASRVVTADLVDAQGDRLVLAGVLALDHQHRDAVDKKDHVLPRAVAAVVDVELFGHFVDIAVLIAAEAAPGRRSR